MTAGDTQPTQPLPDWAYAEPAPRRRRHGWIWLVALLIVAGLAVAAWFLGESIARDIVTKTIRDQVVTRLALPADQQVDVDVQGAVLPQVIAGRLDDVTVSSDDVTLGGSFTGDVTVHATGVVFRGDASAQSATATVVLGTGQVQALMRTVDGFPADTLGLSEPDVTMTVELAFFSARFPIGIALTPTARDGDLVLTPATLRLGEAQIDADSLRDRFGVVADAALRDWSVCIAQYLPAAVVLDTVAVQGDQLVGNLTIDPRVISDATLQARGTCA